jgi:hypothetical protein
VGTIDATVTDTRPASDLLDRGGLPVHIDKAEIVATLRSRGQNDRADWVDREMPETIDTDKNGSLLRTLNIDPADMSPADGSPADAGQSHG